MAHEQAVGLDRLEQLFSAGLLPTRLVFFRHVLGRPAVVASDPAKRDWWEGTAGAKAKGFLRNKPGAAWANVYGLEPGTMEGRWPQGSSGVEKVADPS